MLHDGIFRVQLPLVEFGEGTYQQQMCIMWNASHSIRVEAPMHPALIKLFQFGQDHIYIRGQWDDVAKTLEARSIVADQRW